MSVPEADLQLRDISMEVDEDIVMINCNARCSKGKQTVVVEGGRSSLPGPLLS